MYKLDYDAIYIFGMSEQLQHNKTAEDTKLCFYTGDAEITYYGDNWQEMIFVFHYQHLPVVRLCPCECLLGE